MGKIPTSIWKPQAGPQTLFLKTNAYEALFGGAKGGGKSEALLFASLRYADSANYKALILRRTFPKLLELIERSKCFVKLGAEYSVQNKLWRFPNGGIIRFGHCENPGDEINYQGQEYQYIGFDQLEEFTETMYDIIKAQGRSGAGIPVYIRATANPGGIGSLFIKQRFIDGKAPNKKYYKIYNAETGQIKLSRIFIPSTIYDNKILLEHDPTYIAKLMDLPEKYRRMYLNGDWNIDNDPDQLITYDFIKEITGNLYNFIPTEIFLRNKFAGVDIARYGNDKTCIAIIDNGRLSEISSYEGIDLVTSANIIKKLIEENGIPPGNIAIDTDGIGAGVYDNLKSCGYNTNAVTGGSKPVEQQNQSYGFRNLRSQIYWNMREIIRRKEICFAKHEELINELLAIKYKISQDRMIQIESKDEIKKRISKSPDFADAFCYALSVPILKSSQKVSVTIF